MSFRNIPTHFYRSHSYCHSNYVFSPIFRFLYSLLSICRIFHWRDLFFDFLLYALFIQSIPLLLSPIFSLNAGCVVYFIYKLPMNRQPNMLITTFTLLHRWLWQAFFFSSSSFRISAEAKLNFCCDVSIGTNDFQWNHRVPANAYKVCG